MAGCDKRPVPLRRPVGLEPFSALARTARCPLVLQSPACGGLCTRGNLGKGNPLRVPRCIPSGNPPFTNSPVPTQHRNQADAWLPALGQGENVQAGTTYGRCITSQGERSCSPDTPMTKGRNRRPSGHPRSGRLRFSPEPHRPFHGDQSKADWMAAMAVAPRTAPKGTFSGHLSG